MPFKLDPRAPAGDEIVRAIREQLAASIEFVATRSEPVAERIHFARTSCKKARAALKLLRSQDRAGCRRENRWLAAAARKLAPLRDADATADCLKTLVQRHAPKARQRKFTAMLPGLRGAKSAPKRTPAEIERKLARFATRLRSSDARLAHWERNDDPTLMIDDHRRAYRQARAGLHGAQALGTATAFHEWRKALKTYSHQCRLLRAAWPPAMKELRDELKQLAALLGEEHDLSVLRKRLRTLQRKGGGALDRKSLAAALDWLERRRDELRALALPLGERLFADRPRAVAERMHQWWHVARNQPEFADVA